MALSISHENIKEPQVPRLRTAIGLDVNQSLDAQDAFRPIPGLISCAGATGSVACMYEGGD